MPIYYFMDLDWTDFDFGEARRVLVYTSECLFRYDCCAYRTEDSSWADAYRNRTI